MINTLQRETQTTKTIKLGIDVHKEFYSVCVQLDGTTPKPAQKYEPYQLVDLVKDQTKKGYKVFSCYEAGLFGFNLHRELTKIGATNYVVHPQNWDETGKGVKTDKHDARALVLRLDRYTSGNKESFTVVRPPSEEEESKRTIVRQCEQLKRTRQRLMNQTKSTLLYYANPIDTRFWWSPSGWKKLEVKLPAWLLETIEPYRQIVLSTIKEEERLEKRLEDLLQIVLPRYFGYYTYLKLKFEVCDWNRFSNRGQVSSFTGLCPREFSSGGKCRRGSINKHGNPALRETLVELAWRMASHQPNYRGTIRFNEKCKQENGSPKKKKLIVAMARELGVDTWRVATGQTTFEKLGFIM